MPKNSLLEKTIAWYVEQGYILFPLNGKHPPKNYHWRETEFNPFACAADFPSGNFGIALRPEDLIIDVDPRNFKGQDSFNEFVAIVTGFDPQLTFTVTTGSRGQHIYLKKPAEIHIRKVLKGYKGIDFLSDGCYVVGAGSIHPETKKVYEPHFGSIAVASPRLLEIITKPKLELSHGTEKYDETEQTRDRYREYLAHAPLAIEGESGDQTTFAVAAVGHDFGLSPLDCFTLLTDEYNPRCQPPWSLDDLQKKVDNAYKYTESPAGSQNPVAQFEKVTIQQLDPDMKLFHRDCNGQIKKNLHNTTIFFGKDKPLDNLLAFNDFSKDIVFLKPAPWHHRFEKPKIWTDGEALRAKFWLSHQFKIEPGTPIMHEAAYVAATMRPFHPVKEYLSTLAWDGHKRVHNWLINYLGAEDNEYTRAVGTKFLVAAVKRIYEPGCKFDYILVLEGKQGTFKSTTFEILASKEWYCDPAVDITNKDVVGYMFGKWIIELPEMETHRRTETTAMKAFLSRNTDRCRMPYARVTIDFPRQCIFGGTINPEKDEDIGYLKDSTGNRRYWPVAVGVTKTPDLTQLSAVRNQLWAEAMALYEAKYPIYLDDLKIVEMAQAQQKARMGRDIWTETIERYIIVKAKNRVVVTAEELFSDALGGNILHCGRREHVRIASVMEQLGWEKGVFYNIEAKKPERGYRRPMLELAEVLE